MYFQGVRRPYRKVYALLSPVLGGMRSQLPENVIVGSLAKQLLIQICHEIIRPFFSASLCSFFSFFHNLTPVLL